MGSGTKRLIVNTRERAVSADINRLQQFASADLAELLNNFALASTSDDLESGGVASYTSSTNAPLTAEILNGFEFVPEVGTVNGSITGGVLICANPDFAPLADDSPIKYVRDTGATGINLTANSSGSARVDVVEIQRADTVVETSTRDVFDVGTGLFTPTTVDKAAVSKCNYRIRLGTPGGGYPGSTSGWLPIAVAYVPTGTTTWDTVTVWDVRPLVADHIGGTVARRNRDWLTQGERNFNIDASGGTTLYVSGFSESMLFDRRVGGHFPDGGGADRIDLKAAAYKDPTFTGSPKLAWLYLATPCDLPRWVKYTPAAFGSRKPRGPRGMPVLSHLKPGDARGRPSSAIGVPLIGGTTSAAVCVASVYWAAGLSFYQASGRLGFHDTPASIPTINAAATSTTQIDFSLIDGVDIPPNARSIRVRVNFTFDYTTSADNAFIATCGFLSGARFLGGPAEFRLVPTTTTVGQTQRPQLEFEVPLLPTWPANLSLPTRTLRVLLAGANGAFNFGTPANATVRVIGWDLGG